jgi:threonine dehydrogenase-like Zn-dependent dehydrogenase
MLHCFRATVSLDTIGYPGKTVLSNGRGHNLVAKPPLAIHDRVSLASPILTNSYPLMSIMSMKESELDVLVIGAGPAGLMCGYALAKAGVNVRIVDKRYVV